MPSEVIILAHARNDIEAGKNFYDRCEIGVGDYFVEGILHDITSLKFHFGEPKKFFGMYRILSKRFPFAIYYTVIKDVVNVVAVLDMRMKPSSIQYQLKHRR